MSSLSGSHVVKKGRRNKRIVIWRATRIDDGTATVLGAPENVGARWANRTDVSDGERMRASQLGQELTTRFELGNDSLTRTIGGADLIECSGRKYEVVGVKFVGDRDEAIEVTTSSKPDTRIGG